MSNAPDLILVASRTKPLEALIPIFEHQIRAGRDPELILYRELNPGDKANLTLGPKHASELRARFKEAKIRFLDSAAIGRSLMQGNPHRVVLSFESRQVFTQMFGFDNFAWIQIQANGDLINGISLGGQLADGYALIGSGWFEEDFIESLEGINRGSLRAARTQPHRVIGVPHLTQSLAKHASRIETTPTQVPVFLPNWLPAGPSGLLNLASKLSFFIRNRGAMSQLRESATRFRLCAESRHLELSLRNRAKSTAIDLGFAEQPTRSNFSQRPYFEDIIESAFIVTFLPSFSIWESLFFGKLPAVFEAPQILSAIPNLSNHPQVTAYKLLFDSGKIGPPLGGLESIHSWFDFFDSAEPERLQAAVKPWLEPVADFGDRLEELATEVWSRFHG